MIRCNARVFLLWIFWRKNTKRCRELWWQGIPSKVRGRVWLLVIKNELNLTEGTWVYRIICVFLYFFFSTVRFFIFSGNFFYGTSFISGSVHFFCYFLTGNGIFQSYTTFAAQELWSDFQLWMRREQSGKTRPSLIGVQTLELLKVI